MRFFFLVNLFRPIQILVIPWTFAVVNLTLIDLPGLTKVAVGKQWINIYFLSMVFLHFRGNCFSFIMNDLVLTYGYLLYRGSARQYCA